MQSFSSLLARCMVGACLSLALPWPAAAARNETAPSQTEASPAAGRNGSHPVTGRTTGISSAPAGKVDAAPAAPEAAKPGKTALNGSCPLPSFTGSEPLDFSAAASTDLLEFAPLVPPRTGWVSMESGSRPAYVGIHGGTAHLSLLRASNGVLFAFTGQTGNDFMHVLRGDTVKGSAQNASAGQDPPHPTPASPEAAMEAAAPSKAAAPESHAETPPAQQGEKVLPETNAPQERSLTAAARPDKGASPSPLPSGGASSGLLAAGPAVSAAETASPVSGRSSGAPSTPPQAASAARADSQSGPVPAVSVPVSADSTAQAAPEGSTPSKKTQATSPVPPGQPKPIAQGNVEDGAGAPPPKASAGQPQAGIEAQATPSTANSGDPVTAGTATLPPGHRSLIFASSELANSIKNSADAFAPFGLNVPDDAEAEPQTHLKKEQAPRKPRFKPLKLRSYQAILHNTGSL